MRARPRRPWSPALLPALVGWALLGWGWSVAAQTSGDFSGLKGQIEQTLQSALAQTTPLKPLWALPVAASARTLAATQDPSGVALLALTDGDGTSLRLWSQTGPWGDALGLGGERIDQVSLVWDATGAWAGWSGSGHSRVGHWSGLNWVDLGLPPHTVEGTLFWAPGGLLWAAVGGAGGVELRSFRYADGWVASSRSAGFALPAEASWSLTSWGGRCLLAVTGPTGGLYQLTSPDSPWRSLAFPGPFDALPGLGSWGEALVVQSMPAGELFVLAPGGSWTRLDGAPHLDAVAPSPGLLVGVRRSPTGLQLESFDGQDWRHPLDLSALAGAEASVGFLGPSARSRGGSLILGGSGWQLP